jgi:hypothetical protein
MGAFVKLTLRFSPAPQEAAEASGTVRVVDQSEADAPAREIAAHPFGPVPLDPGGSSVTVTLPEPETTSGASLNIRAEVRDASGGVAQFLNTSAVPAPPPGAVATSVELDRI